ncbi:acyl-CoA dehydrogenase domain-containing protein [Alicyclobacillus hesperidum URH17-3-68]|uniref:Acyl-CoA dehydrogenase n=1 Tax=Alicyclobacillus hesperidum TaxID=89784 RepID=A0A1H2SRB9_9BACL|nr:acyl-CoA dehydrogenase family protein [Alicyclobacillus hesperidum]EJY55118.1 acyl-CoA dehydrogenase domain-containing protein [Alicyclobacillus hesperidum URH17-3-68]GLV12512.1 putative acyl-CoA dehydrogenase [Alicyclobacillus hesperidum]SDW34128.1 Acyl-CoA dehydrogenase [Alicyclobacillus hesperidum]
MANKTLAIGGGFIIEDTDPNSIVTPESLTDEQRMIAETTTSFVEAEVSPHQEQIEGLDYELTVKLLRKAGEIGLLSTEIPEAYGGLGLDKMSATLINERVSKAGSFGLSLGAHTGIGTLPIVYFGNEQQKQKYLPKLATGEWIAAYCLTEPSSGSDALGAKTTARLSDDGKYYILNGTKQFITNAGFADVFVVYAKVDGKLFSTFIVERTMPGVSVGPEEQKMGIKGSSTRQLILEDVHVPVENLLYEVGKGHQIAFNILNIGRFKLAAGAVGGSKDAIELAAHYANERQQFGRKISSFPLIQQKLARMNTRTFVLESVVYRTAGLLDAALADVDVTGPNAGMLSAKAIAEYAIECSINKVFASETLDYVVDEALQIHGGYGFIKEYKVERMYRDSRINRIFEGTNEINRLLIPGTMLRRAMKGELPLLQKAQALQAELMQMTPALSAPEGTLAEEAQYIANAKRIFLMVGGLAAQAFQQRVDEEQEVLSNLADIAILTFAMESAWLRTMQHVERAGEGACANAIAMTKAFAYESLGEIERLAKECLARIEQGDALRMQLSVVKRLARRTELDIIGLEREIGRAVVDAEQYVC